MKKLPFLPFLMGYLCGFGSGFLTNLSIMNGSSSSSSNNCIFGTTSQRNHDEQQILLMPQAIQQLLGNDNKNKNNNVTNHNLVTTSSSSSIDNRVIIELLYNMTTHFAQFHNKIDSTRNDMHTLLAKLYEPMQRDDDEEEEEEEDKLVRQMTSAHNMLETIIKHLFINNNNNNDAATTTTNNNDDTIQEEEEEEERNRRLPKLAKLQCKGGGSQLYQDMVYWRDIPEDDDYHKQALFNEQQQQQQKERFLTVELDAGGFNNIRMTLEIAMVWAYATGRTFVLPPKQGIYLLSDKETFTLHDFYNLQDLNVMEMEDFLKEQVLTGKLLKKKKKNHTNDDDDDDDEPLLLFPPNNRTDWSKSDRPRTGVFASKDSELLQLHYYLRNISGWSPDFTSGTTLVFFPKKKKKKGDTTTTTRQRIQKDYGSIFTMNHTTFLFQASRPIPTNAPAAMRLQEVRQHRLLHIVNEEEEEEQEPHELIHIMSEDHLYIRLMSHFYHQFFFEDWRTDLRVKRYVRDKLHYRDEFFCTAGRILENIHIRSSRSTNRQDDTTPTITNLDKKKKKKTLITIHVRRNDFAHIDMITNATELLDRIEKELPSSILDDAILYIATDESDRQWFTPLMERFSTTTTKNKNGSSSATYFLNDFMDDILLSDHNIHPSSYGMIDQIVAAKGDYFFAPHYSTFAGHIIHMRGYYSQLAQDTQQQKKQQQQKRRLEEGYFKKYVYLCTY